jgi:uncharacterized UBP type Zn finger protein
MVVLDMGIPKARAEMALRETGNSGVEVAAEWLFSHLEVSSQDPLRFAMAVIISIYTVNTESW